MKVSGINIYTKNLNLNQTKFGEPRNTRFDIPKHPEMWGMETEDEQDTPKSGIHYGIPEAPKDSDFTPRLDSFSESKYGGLPIPGEEI